MHGGTQGPWGVHGYMYMGCYTDQGLWGEFKLSIYNHRKLPADAKI